MSTLSSALRLILLVVCWFLGSRRSVLLVLGEAHPHTGKATPFKSGDPGIQLNRQALSVLQSGKPYKTQVQDEATKSGRGMVVQDVQAPTDVVWDRILDFDAYSNMVPKTVSSKIYKRQKEGRRHKHHQAERLWVQMKVGFPMLKLQFYVNHLYDPAHNSMTWTLDYSKKSDLDDSCGFWYVVPHPDAPETASRVYYSVDVRMFPWVPQFVVDFMSKQALLDATSWVKKYSEKAYQKQLKEEGAAKKKQTSDSSSLGIRHEQNVPKEPWWRRKAAATTAPPLTLAASSRGKNDKDPTYEDDSDQILEQQQHPPVRLLRVGLVTTALALSFFNVHLYFSH